MKNLIPFTLFTFDRLDIKPPPSEAFETLLGYSGDLRFVGFSYQAKTLCIEDGQMNEVGDRRPWSIWYRSLGISIFKNYCFGYDGRNPDHMLILDRKSRALFAAPVQTAHEALRQRVPRSQETSTKMLSQADVDKRVEDPTDLLVSTMSTADCELHHEKKRAGMEQLENWLGYRNR